MSHQNPAALQILGLPGQGDLTNTISKTTKPMLNPSDLIMLCLPQEPQWSINTRLCGFTMTHCVFLPSSLSVSHPQKMAFKFTIKTSKKACHPHHPPQHLYLGLRTANTHNHQLNLISQIFQFDHYFCSPINFGKDFSTKRCYAIRIVATDAWIKGHLAWRLQGN